MEFIFSEHELDWLEQPIAVQFTILRAKAMNTVKNMADLKYK